MSHSERIRLQEIDQLRVKLDGLQTARRAAEEALEDLRAQAEELRAQVAGKQRDLAAAEARVAADDVLLGRLRALRREGGAP